ncbi:MAG: excinuclease ABC subunit UvrC [Cyclobacteriaceae bacterium]|nr:excinuclease ABC subunit UvrC [Cyclobacteriaceae bacterium]
MNTPSYTTEQVKTFPDKPGVYRFYNAEQVLIYVGKAKSLKARVSSYFNDLQGHNRKTRKMVSEITSIEFTLVNTEFDALLLENNLIKEHQPRYNILLRDDKTFPYICISNEPFPRLLYTRKFDPEKGKFFGPYASVGAMKNLLDLLRTLFHIRTCSLALTNENINKGKFKICLEYHIGRCNGPCEALQNEQEYLKDIDKAENIIKGNLSPARHYFKEEMQKAAASLEFEKAQLYKNKLELLEKYQAKSVIANASVQDVDVAAIVSDDKRAYINYLIIYNGCIINSKNVEIRKKLDETEDEILTQVLVELRNTFKSKASEVLTNVPLAYSLNIEHKVPKIGDKRQLLDLAIKNAMYIKKEKLKASDPDYYREKRVLKQLQDDLRLKVLPEHIECFDNSNLMGTNPVASMVCFKKGKPSKKDYRKYNVKTVTGPDDFASMREVVGRRYKRIIDEGQPLPDLIVIDGGKGQLNAAVEAIHELDLYGQIPIIGIAKRLEEIYFPGDQFAVHIHKKSESLRLLQYLRNEAHRFAITFHRQKRSKSALGSELTDIDGIGTKTAEKLLKHFKSIKKIKEASPEELHHIVGPSVSKKIMTNLQSDPKSKE